MNARPTPSPIEVVVPLQRSLAAHGHDVSPWALVDACAGDLSLGGFARCAREQGLDARIVTLSAGDLSYLPLGTIIEFDDQSRATVVTHCPAGVEVEDKDRGRRRIGEEDDVEPVAALEIRTPPAAGRFLSRLSSRLRDEPHIGRSVVFGALLTVVLTALGTTVPLLTRYAFGSAIPDRAASQLTLLAAAIAVTGLHVLYVGALRRALLLFLSTKLAEVTTGDLVSHMMRLPLTALRRLDFGDIRSTFLSASSAAEAIPNTLAPHVLDAVFGVTFLVLTFLLDPRSALVTALAALAVLLAGYVNGRLRLSLKRQVLTRRRAQQQVLYETLAGIETVKSENVEGRMLAKWLDRLVAEEQAALALRCATSRFGTLVDMVERSVFAAVLLLTAQRCLEGAGAVADLVAAVQASTSFMIAAVKLGRLPAAFAEFKGDTERVDEMLLRPAEGDVGACRASARSGLALVLRDVWFRYEDDGPWVLAGLHLAVKPGERLLLAWPSGAGKSTLLRLLAGLVPPCRGDVLLFGTEASRARRLVTYIPQQATLFMGSVMENLRLLSGNARPERLLAAAEATGLMPIVSQWPMGMETVLSSGVVNVSSGQRQLILFTATVASEAPILLLDEAMAHMDLEMRARLGAADFFRDRTVISVVHDASSAEAARGRLVTVDDMMAGPGPFYGHARPGARDAPAERVAPRRVSVSEGA
jgi:ATP-binding cassette, subfamily B, bacterial CvaB/MchF/RaxB